MPMKMAIFDQDAAYDKQKGDPDATITVYRTRNPVDIYI